MADLPDDQRLALELLTARKLIAKGMERAFAAESELAALRLIVTEKFAGADMYVKPEDAADVAKWASNAQHVRELLKRAEYHQADEEGGNSPCVECGSDSYSAHFGPCLIAAAWRALGDPRGAADIERAHEEALREQDRRKRPPTFNHGGGWVGIGDARSIHPEDEVVAQLSPGGRIEVWPGMRPSEIGMVPFRRASESQAAAQGRMLIRALNVHGVEISVPIGSRIPEGFTLWPARQAGAMPYLEDNTITANRRASDARGMEAVEDEARREENCANLRLAELAERDEHNRNIDAGR